MSVAGSAAAQNATAVGVDCPPWIEQQMGFTPGPDTLCSAWKQGMGDGLTIGGASVLNFRFSPPPGNACGANSLDFPGRGQLIFVEPTGCSASGADTCPGQILDGDLIGAPGLGLSFREIGVRTNLGSFVILSPINFRHGSDLNRSQYTRYDCNGPLPDSITGANGRCIGGENFGDVCTVDANCGTVNAKCSLSSLVDTSECTGTIAVWEEELIGLCVGGGSPGSACDSDAECGGGSCSYDSTRTLNMATNRNGDPSAADPCQRSGDALCCQSTNPTFCPNAVGHQLYPVDPAGGLGCLVNIPINQPIDARRLLSPPVVFDDQLGSNFRQALTWTRDDQIWGNCSGDRSQPCSINDDPQTNGDAFCAVLGLGFCNRGEPGIRVNASDLVSPSGLPDDNRCSHVSFTLAGLGTDANGVSSLCAVPEVWLPGQGSRDPTLGCLVRNFGSYANPDADCDGVDDRPVDLCPAIAEIDGFADSNLDGIGNECQCGDATGDGAITGLDIGATALCANGVNPCNPTLVDVDGDDTTTSLDIGGVVSIVNGDLATSDAQCAQNGS